MIKNVSVSQGSHLLLVKFLLFYSLQTNQLTTYTMASPYTLKYFCNKTMFYTLFEFSKYHLKKKNEKKKYSREEFITLHQKVTPNNLKLSTHHCLKQNTHTHACAPQAATEKEPTTEGSLPL